MIDFQFESTSSDTASQKEFVAVNSEWKHCSECRSSEDCESKEWLEIRRKKNGGKTFPPNFLDRIAPRS
jgi:hypothetical protein